MISQAEIDAIHKRWYSVKLKYRELVSHDGITTEWRDLMIDDGLLCMRAQLSNDGLVIVDTERPIEQERRVLWQVAHAAKDVGELVHVIGNMQMAYSGVQLFEQKITQLEAEIEELRRR